MHTKQAAPSAKSNPPQVGRTAGRRAWRLGLPMLSAMAIALLLTLVAAPAEAQLTAEALIGDSVSAPDSPRYSDVNEAIKRFGNRDILSAQQFLETAKRKDPKLPPVTVMLAKMYALTGQSKAVRPALEMSINDAADDPEPYLLLAEGTLQARQYIEADALFDKSVRLIEKYNQNPKRKRSLTIRAYRGRAAISERRKKWQAAADDLQVWLTQDPDDPIAHTQMGQALCMLDKVEEGRKEFVKARELDPKRAHPYVMSAQMFERRGQQANALKDYERAYAEGRTDETTLVTYSQALIRAGDLQKASQVLKAAREAAPESLNVWILSGVAARMSGSAKGLEAAEQAFIKALSLAPGNRDVYSQLAQILAGQDDKDKRRRALQFAATNAKVYPNNVDAKVTLAWAYFQNGRTREANAALRNSLQAGGAGLGADARVLVAKMFIASGQEENAKRLLTSALAENEGIFVMRAEAEKLLASL